MNILARTYSNIRGFFKASKPEVTASTTTGESYQKSNHIMTITYDGEKNPGELGVIKKYRISYRALRLRAWQIYLESDVVQAVIGKFKTWVVGSGIRIQAVPMTEVLEDSGITISEKTISMIEKRWSLFVKSKKSVYDGQMTLDEKSAQAFENAAVGGDTLVILHVINGKIKVQCVDGEHVYTPYNSSEVVAAAARGNTIRDGVEINAEGEHIAYYVRDRRGFHGRVEARSKTGILVAYMIYGKRVKYDDTRGMPVIASVLESIKKLDRYKEAIVGGAEERAKIAYFFEHEIESTGENPLAAQMRSSVAANQKVDGASDYPDESIKTAAKITATTGKQTFNLPQGVTIKAMVSDMEANFKDFFRTNLEPLCAAVDIPIEVVLSKFENNFSSSRAALKNWEHTVKINRTAFGGQFFKPIYDLWLLLEDARKSIRLDGYFDAFVLQRDDAIYEAYTRVKYTGVNIPHVDPVKEAEAIRKKLGKKFENIPLITIQNAMEELGTGDFDDMVTVLENELNKIEDIIEEEEPAPPPTSEPQPNAD